MPTLLESKEDAELAAGLSCGGDQDAQRQNSVSALNITISGRGETDNKDCVTLSSKVMVGKRLDLPDETESREIDEVDKFEVGRGGTLAEVVVEDDLRRWPFSFVGMLEVAA